MRLWVDNLPLTEYLPGSPHWLYFIAKAVIYVISSQRKSLPYIYHLKINDLAIWHYNFK